MVCSSFSSRLDSVSWLCFNPADILIAPIWCSFIVQPNFDQNFGHLNRKHFKISKLLWQIWRMGEILERLPSLLLWGDERHVHGYSAWSVFRLSSSLYRTGSNQLLGKPDETLLLQVWGHFSGVLYLSYPEEVNNYGIHGERGSSVLLFWPGRYGDKRSA